MDLQKTLYYTSKLKEITFPYDESNNEPIYRFYPRNYCEGGDEYCNPEAIWYCDTWVAMLYLGMVHEEMRPPFVKRFQTDLSPIYSKITQIIPPNPDYEPEVLALLEQRRNLIKQAGEKYSIPVTYSAFETNVKKIIEVCVLKHLRDCREQHLTPHISKSDILGTHRINRWFVYGADNSLVWCPVFKGSHYYQNLDNSDLVTLNTWHPGWGLMVLICAMFLENGEMSLHEIRTAFERFVNEFTVFIDVTDIVFDTIFSKADTSELDIAIQTVLNNNPKAIQDIKQGKDKAIGALVGQVMKQIKTDPVELKTKILALIKEMQ